MPKQTGLDEMIGGLMGTGDVEPDQAEAVTSDSAEEIGKFLVGGSPAMQFPEKGCKYEGEIIAKPELVQQRDYDSGDPLTWKDGNPRMQLVLTLQCEAGCDSEWRDPAIDADEDDGERRLFVKGQMQKALGKALRNARVRVPAPGARLSVEYVRDGKKTDPKKQPPKQYELTYTPADS